MAEIKLTKENFDAEINSDMPVLVDFWAEWCPPCKMLAPIIEEIAAEYAGRAKICKVNVDEEQELAAKYNIEFIPTLILFKNGEIKSTSTGYVPKSEIEKMLS